MRGHFKLTVALILLFTLALPAQAQIAEGLSGLTSFTSSITSLVRTGVSFGGRVLTVLPCSGGMIHVTIVPAGLFPVSYIWTPATITKLVGPPVHPGQQLLGVADVPFVCFLGGGLFSSPIPLYGLRMQTVGTGI